MDMLKGATMLEGGGVSSTIIRTVGSRKHTDTINKIIFK